jgi:hypothetical protein
LAPPRERDACQVAAVPLAAARSPGEILRWTAVEGLDATRERAVDPTNDEANTSKLPSCNDQPEVVERLERLDDVIFPAIDGDPAALEACAPEWQQAVAELGPELVAETRSEYLRYARSVWQYLSRQTVQQPWRVLAVMKIIGLLMGDDV